MKTKNCVVLIRLADQIGPVTRQSVGDMKSTPVGHTAKDREEVQMAPKKNGLFST